MTPLPVLNYHGIDQHSPRYTWTEGEKFYVVSPEVFEKQMDYIASSGFHSLDTLHLGRWLKKAGVKKPILITFDDGHISHFEYAAPYLKQKKLGGLFFVSAGFVGKKEYMDWDQLRELVRQGFEIGSHGVNHVALTKLSDPEIEREIKGSKELIEKELGVEISSFSVPRGFYSERISEFAQKAGYQFVFTSKFDFNYPNSNPFALKRVVVTRTTSFEIFDGMIHGSLGLRKYVESAKEMVRGKMKPEWYQTLSRVKQSLSPKEPV